MSRHHFDDFRAGYIAAALFSSTANHPDLDGNDDRSFQDLGMDESDMAPSTLAAINADCRAFLANCADLVAACQDRHKPGSPGDSAWNHAGRDLWYTREAHGCGFWDGDWPEPWASRLDEAARALGSADWCIGDDGLIYQFGSERLAA